MLFYIYIYIYIYIFEYVGKMSSFKQTLLNSKLHFCLISFVETFSKARTDFRRSGGRSKIRDPKFTDMMNHPYNTKLLLKCIIPTFLVSYTHSQGNYYCSFYTKNKKSQNLNIFLHNFIHRSLLTSLSSISHT